MSDRTKTVCFTCGLNVEHPPRLNRLTNGQLCPACRDRVLDGLPAALPSCSPYEASDLTEANLAMELGEEDWDQGRVEPS